MNMLRIVTRGRKIVKKPVVENCERGPSKVIDLYLQCDRTQKVLELENSPRQH